MSKKKSKSAVESAILKCGGKVGSKKQKLQTGGEVLIQSFDYNTLSSQDKAAYLLNNKIKLEQHLIHKVKVQLWVAHKEIRLH